MPADPQRQALPLLPCPFCGCECNEPGKPTQHADGCWFKVDRAWRHAVADNLDFSLTQDVIDSWNRRAATDSQAAAGPYRLLQRGDLLAAGDQSLDDDCATWSPVHRLFVGHPFRPEFHVPHRRAMTTAVLQHWEHTDQPQVIGVDLATGPDITAHILSKGAREKLIETLEAARNGLKWYRDALPAADSGADEEMHAAIDEALALLGAAEGDTE